MAQDDKTFTQADVDRFVAEEKRRGQAQIESLTKAHEQALGEKESAIAALSKERDEARALSSQADEQRQAIEKERDEARLAASRFSVALDAGIPKALAARLQGDDEESLKADASSLAELLKRDEATGGTLAGPTVPPDEPKTMNDLIRSAAGRDGS